VNADTASADFGYAVQAILRLPLSDADKAEAIRRLLNFTNQLKG